MAMARQVSQLIVERLGWTLLNSVWQWLVVGLLAWLILTMLRNRTPQTRYVAGVILLAVGTLGPFITYYHVAPATGERNAQLRDLSATIASVHPDNPGDKRVDGRLPDVSTAGAFFDRIESSGGASNNVATSVPAVKSLFIVLQYEFQKRLPILVAAWLIGVVFFSARLSVTWWRVQCLTRKNVMPIAGSLREAADRICVQLRVPTVRLLESVVPHVPMAVGWLRPVVLFPTSILVGLAPDQLEALLAHELAHLKRRDYLVNLAQSVVEILFFYHPVVWWLSRTIRCEREEACDDLAVSVVENSLVYARALTELASDHFDNQKVAVAASSGRLLHRIERLVLPKVVPQTFLPPLSAGFVCLSIALSATIVATGLHGVPSKETDETLTFAGKCVTTSGEPVPAATVELFVRGASVSIEKQRLFAATKTDKQGRFSFEYTPRVLDEGLVRYVAVVNAAGKATYRTPLDNSTKNRESLSFALQDSGNPRGQITDAASTAPQQVVKSLNVICVNAKSNPVAGAEVHLFQFAGGKEGRYLHFGPFTSNEKGIAVCPDKIVRDERGHFDRFIYARVPGRLVGVARSAQWRNDPVINPTARVELVPSRPIEGKVNVPIGFDSTKVTVRVRVLHVYTGPAEFDFQSFPREDQFQGINTALADLFECRADGSGRIRFDDVPVRGNLYLVASAPGLGEAQWRNENHAFDQPIQLSIGAESVLSARVLTPSGSPAAGMIVTARISPTALYLSSFGAVSDGQGKCTIHGLPQRKFVLSVQDPRKHWTFRPISDLRVEPNEEANATLTMETGVLVSGRVSDGEGNPVEGAAISAVADGQGRPGLGGDMTDANGRYQLRLPSGIAELYFNSLPHGFAYPSPQIIKRLDIQPKQADLPALDFTLKRQKPVADVPPLEKPSRNVPGVSTLEPARKASENATLGRPRALDLGRPRALDLVEKQAAADRRTEPNPSVKVLRKAKRKNYLLFAITTELQRILLFSTKADAYVQFDVGECMDDGELDLQRFDAEAFRKELAARVRQIHKAEPRLFISFRYAGISWEPNGTKTNAMQKVITGICRDAGFAKVQTGMAGEGGSWQDKIASLGSLTDDVDSSESPIEDEFVRVYPVRTRLSRFLLGDSRYDCYIDLRQPIDGRFQEFSPAARRTIGQRVAKLELRQKRKLTFHCLATTAGQANVERYFAKRAGNPPMVDAFVKEIGFHSSSYSMMPMGVSPENLLGKQAPDFTLEGLDGGQIHLHEMIRGRVAVIAFWGVACGACCDEAPHLTAIFNKYRDQGLIVVAVNGYDESKDVVDRFARSKGLAHQIALKGSKVAEGKYTVQSYPVTFLVDRTGAIADYHLGFDPGDEKRLEQGVAHLLVAVENAKVHR